MTLIATTVSDNTAAGYGGGIIIGGMTTLTNCAVSGNSAGGGGGGISSSGPTALTNCTVSDNTADGVGGGMSSCETTITLTDCTVSGNTGTSAFGGIYLSGTAMLDNTIVAGNTDSSGASDIGGPGTVSGSNNLIGTGGSGGLINGVDGNLVGVANPGLAPLGDYGGPTETMALLARQRRHRRGRGRQRHHAPTSGGRPDRLPAPSTSVPSRTRATPWPFRREALKARRPASPSMLHWWPC